MSSPLGAWVWLDNKIVNIADATVPVTDRGYLCGEGVFETIGTVGGRPFAISRHHTRLSAGAGRLGLEAPGREEFEEAIGQVLSKANQDAAPSALPEMRIRVTLTSAGSGGEAHTCITAAPAPDYPASATAITSEFRRNPQGTLAGIKTTSYAENTVALREAQAAGADEVIFGDHQGNLSEGSMSNVFCRYGDRLITPPLESGCLPGITRALCLEIGDVIGTPVTEIHSPLCDLPKADEIFLTSSLRGVQPLRAIDGQSIATPADGVAARFAETLQTRKAEQINP